MSYIIFLNYKVNKIFLSAIMFNTSMLHLIGYHNYVCNVDRRDVRFCLQYATTKPPPVCQEFFNLAEILMQENDWDLPNDCEAALILYCNLKNSIHTIVATRC